MIVSIHDVTPALGPAVRSLAALCDEIGVVPALFVVPDWHGRAPLGGDRAFGAWLAERAAAGCEIALHGDRHDEVGSPRGWRDAVRAIGRTAAEGEFLTLDGAAAAARMRRGVGALATAGLAPTGFVPPAWLCREATHAAAAALGFAWSEDTATIRDHVAGRVVASPVIRWSGRTPARGWASAAVARARRSLVHDPRPVRIALHPGDLAHPATRESVATELRWWAARRPAARYAAVVGTRLATAGTATR